jgi:hypothetical protein
VACQTGIEKAANTLQGSMLKALTAASDTMRKKGITFANAVAVDKAIQGGYAAGKAIDKFRLALDKLYLQTTCKDAAKNLVHCCTDTDLSALGYLVSGGAATGVYGGFNPAPPVSGGNGIKFTEDYLIAQSESNAYSQLLAASPLFANQLLEMQNMAGCGRGALSCKGAFCKYLCNLKPECMERVCMLGPKTAEGGNSTSKTQTYSWKLGHAPYLHNGATEDSLGDADPINFCFMDGDSQFSTITTETDIVYLVAPSKVRSLEMVNLTGIYVCVDTLRSTGFCDCSGGAAGLKNIRDCQDRDSLKTCGAPPSSFSATHELCVKTAAIPTLHCAVTTGTSCTTANDCPTTPNDACGSSCAAQQADPSYPGDYNGLPNISATVATATGDCVQQLTNQFTVLDNSSMYGPDSTPCTGDDTGGVNSPTAVVLTTGHSQSTLKNSVVNYGVCEADPSVFCVNTCQNTCITGFCQYAVNSPGGSKVCKTDADCDHTCLTTCLGGANDGDPCTSDANCPGGSCIIYDTHTSAETDDIFGAQPTISGGDPPQYGDSACKRYQQNHLRGMKLAGSFPGSSSGQGSGLGDNMSVFWMECK